MQKCNRILILFLGLILCGKNLLALELSMVSGFYKDESYKTGGADFGGKSSIELGARASDAVDRDAYWYGEGNLFFKSYDAPSGGESPDNSTGIAAGGGLRFFLSKFSESIRPFIAGGGSFESVKDASFLPTGYSEKETSGLYYKGLSGLRFTLDPNLFLELEVEVFKSALFETERKETKNVATGAVTKEETTRKQLYVKTDAVFDNVKILFGLKL